MKLSTLKDFQEIELINDIYEDKDIEDVYIGDLLSFVMAKGIEESIWLTVQRNINVIAVAQLNDFSGIIFVEDVDPDENTLNKAIELKIPLFKTSLDAFALSRLLINKGL